VIPLGEALILVVTLALVPCACSRAVLAIDPQPVVEDFGRAPLPARVEVRYADGLDERRARTPAGDVRYGGAVVRLFESLAPVVFGAAGAPDGVLRVEAELPTFRIDPQIGGACAVSFRCRVALETVDGAAIARWDFERAADQVKGAFTTDAGCVAEATALALQDIAADWAARTARDAAVLPWTTRLGPRPMAPPAVVEESWRGPYDAAPPAPPAPVTKREPIPPRTLSGAIGLGVALPQSTATHRDAKGSLAVSLAGSLRVLPWLAVTLDTELSGQSWQAPPAPSAWLILPSDRISMMLLSIAPGARAGWFGGVVEPWLSLAPAVVIGKAEWPATLLGIPGTIGDATGVTLGGQVGAGVDVYLGAHFLMGLRYRRLFASLTLPSTFGGTSAVGSDSVLLSAAWSAP
jgi:hypothetical protein